MPVKSTLRPTLSCLALGRKLSAPFLLFAVSLGGICAALSRDAGGAGNGLVVLGAMALLLAFAAVLPASTMVDVGRDSLVLRTFGGKQRIRFVDLQGVHAVGQQLLLRSRSGWVAMFWLPHGAEALIRARWRAAQIARPSTVAPALLSLVAPPGSATYRAPELPRSTLLEALSHGGEDPRIRIAAADVLCAADEGDTAKEHVLRVATETSDDELRAALEGAARRTRR